MKRILAAFFNSMRGFARAFRTETAVRQEIVALAAGSMLAIVIARSLLQFVLLTGVLLLLLAVEILNTAIEKLCDHVMPDWHERIGYIKDLGSAAVFCLLALTGIVWAAVLFQNFIQ